MTTKGLTIPIDRRIDPTKVTEYLLHPANSRGKSVFFERMEFAIASWKRLSDALISHAEAATKIDAVASPYGVRYIVTGAIETPSGRIPPPIVTTVWQHEEGTEHVRLITAYPAKEAK